MLNRPNPSANMVQIGRATLHLGDCLQVMEGIDRTDALITDPPYCSGSVSEASRSAAKGQGLRSENIRRLGWFTGDNMGTAGLVFLLRAAAFEAVRILPPEGSMLTFCDWRMGLGFRAQHEIILHHTNGSPAYHDMGTANVIRSKRVSADDREHQTQKPMDLMERLIGVVCPPEGTVLDPFMGSGSTGAAAIKAGRAFIGIERDPEHFETACRRLAAVAGHAGPLFGEAA
jgi:site-specific DNA-methyltransferase (adenine-specific)